MSNDEPVDAGAALAIIRSQAAAGNIRLTRHAFSEMIARSIAHEEVLESITSGEVLENYPEHQRGPCCLINGSSGTGRPLHVVCTSALPTLIIITVYEPKMPKWKSPQERNR